MQKTEFIQTMKLVYKAFGKDADTEQMAVYYNFLKFIDAETFNKCAKNLVETESYFPPIAKFIEIIKGNIEVPSQSQVHSVLSRWVMDMDRNVETLKHPVFKMMAEEIGLCDRFSVEQEDFDNSIKYRYNRIVDEYKSSKISGEQLRLPTNKKSLYPYASSSDPEQTDSGFKKLKIVKPTYKEES